MSERHRVKAANACRTTAGAAARQQGGCGSWSTSTAASEQEGNHEHHQEYDKEDLGDTGGGTGDATKAQYRGDNGNDQECDCPAQHGDSPQLSSSWMQPLLLRVQPRAIVRQPGSCLEHPTLLKRLVRHLGLIDRRQLVGGGVADAGSGRTEMGLLQDMPGQALDLHAGLVPALKLLAGNQRDQQRQHCKQSLLQVQWREMEMGGTWTIHPETPPTQ